MERLLVASIVNNCSLSARVGYEMETPKVGFDNLMPNRREWNNCFIKNTKKAQNLLQILRKGSVHLATLIMVPYVTELSHIPWLANQSKLRNSILSRNMPRVT